MHEVIEVLPDNSSVLLTPPVEFYTPTLLNVCAYIINFELQISVNISKYRQIMVHAL